MIRVFIGYDKEESGLAYVLAHSIQNQASIVPSISFINRRTLKGLFDRKRDQLESTDFSISRFLVPYLCNYEGHAIFMDCDILCRDDIAKLWAWRDEFPLRVVKHRHVPLEERKFLGRTQTKYEKKNWSSVMLFNNQKCRALTLDYVNSAPALELHQFKWLKDDSLIGDLPKHWNHLVDYDKYNSEAALIHYTKGGPYFQEFKDCDYHQDWHSADFDMKYIKVKNDNGKN